ncbi:hypothetical protein ACUXAV_004953 [Cupriavidus metallidurans]|jgi:hypothetical protein|uniref:hypothetical protein n=1 Tax=Cupriavidus TaxID=106589 RepID=UPI0004933072|nr:MULTISPECIES: hypothetical protein [Cupriavidus]MCA3188623.1 hypothetical protein [Cupriavidus sp.]MCA3232413.1 hypothetical protein [Cupriavidus sp.]MDE4922663.1 hypothetical protein [Cupriavidus metallidurans]QWE98051.1 hypothetical protein KLP38_29640 [Cupriavidus sp. EM10]GMG94693.1 hypothetical protein Cmtc_59130 [Cupriavidus sp. TKC]
MKTIVVAALLSGMVLTGCEEVEKIGSIVSGEPMTIAFAPGFQIAVEGKPVAVSGFDPCPKRDRAMTKVFGPAPTDGAKECIVVRPFTQSVKVRLSARTDEVWIVLRDTVHPDRMSLRRPDGSLVESFAAYMKNAATVDKAS